MRIRPCIRAAVVSLLLSGTSVAFAASAAPAVTDAGIATLRHWLAQPEGAIDLARAKVEIDRAVGDAIDTEATLNAFEGWAAAVRKRLPPNAPDKVKLEVLLSTMYEPGPWNDHKPFQYDYSDPTTHRVLRNTLVSTYLAARTGQCVVMPVALLLIGQKLGLPMTLAFAPNHIVVKFGDADLGEWVNIEATSGRVHPDSAFEQAMKIPEAAIEKGAYLRPLSQRETVALFASATLAPFYRESKQPEKLLQATELILDANPTDVVAMTMRADAYYLLVEQRLLSRYPTVAEMPPEAREELRAHTRSNEWWYARAEAHGWKRRTEADWAEYLALFNRRKLEQQGAN